MTTNDVIPGFIGSDKRFTQTVCARRALATTNCFWYKRVRETSYDLGHAFLRGEENSPKSIARFRCAQAQGESVVVACWLAGDAGGCRTGMHEAVELLSERVEQQQHVAVTALSEGETKSC
eukprot:scaffold156136_cov53-Attheya_sp.AAC.2